MNRRARPSIITLTLPNWLAGGIEFSLRASRGTIGRDAEEAEVDALADRVRSLLPGYFVEQRYHSIGIMPRWSDPSNTNERIAHAIAIEQTLSGLINSRLISLADWAAAPIHGAWSVDRSDLAATQARYAAVVAVRTPVLEPYFAGERKVANLDAFRAIHSGLDAISAPIARSAHSSFHATQPQRPSSYALDTATLDAAVNKLEALGLVEQVWPGAVSVRSVRPGPQYASFAVRATEALTALYHEDLLRAA